MENLGNSNELAWLPVGYTGPPSLSLNVRTHAHRFLLGVMAVTLPNGKLYGLFNAKYLYIISVVLFMVGSAICGAAPTVNAFIVGRVIAGAGGNGMYIGVLTLLSVNTSDKERPAYLALV